MRVGRYARNGRGASMVEYGLLAGLIAVGAIVSVQGGGERVGALVNSVGLELSAVGDIVSAGDSSGRTAGAASPEPCGGVGGDRV